MSGTVSVVSFGCRLNGVESEAMRAHAVAAGHRDLTIVNTCAVTSEAARQGRQAIRRLRRDDPGHRIVVTGCASETDPARFGAMGEIDAILPNARKTDPALWVLEGKPGDRVRTGASAPDVPPRHSRGFVEVQNGCDHRCTFCIIPFGRGASRSIPVAIVIDRIRPLVEAGAREIVLTGVDLTAYGVDLADRPTLGSLAKAILAALPELPRLRLSSLDCLEVDRDLLDLLASEPRLMPHLHLSLQAGADLILKRMKRRHGRADAIAFCAQARALRPDIVFGADFIAGFPTETEAMFGETLDLVDACGLTHIHVFPYSSRPGTPAARMPAVPDAAIKARAARLREHGDRRLRAHLDAQLGRTLRVLTERGGQARAADFTAVRVPASAAPGVLLDIRVKEHDGRALLADPL